MATKLIQSYVCDKWFVSTIYRQSSCGEFPMWYYETMVWAWDAETRQRAERFAIQEDSGSTPLVAIRRHAEICGELAHSNQQAQPATDSTQQA